MGELFDEARRNAEFRRTYVDLHAEQEKVRIDALKQTSHRRATEFVDIMKTHGVPKIPLANEVWGDSLMTKVFGTEIFYKPERLHKFDVISLGWIAVDKFYKSEDYYWLFVAENTDVTLCTEPRETKIGTVVLPHPHPHYLSDEYLPDRILAKDEMMRGISSRLFELGIV